MPGCGQRGYQSRHRCTAQYSKKPCKSAPDGFGAGLRLSGLAQGVIDGAPADFPGLTTPVS